MPVSSNRGKRGKSTRKTSRGPTRRPSTSKRPSTRAGSTPRRPTIKAARKSVRKTARHISPSISSKAYHKKVSTSHQKLVRHHTEILKNLQYSSGLFAASSKKVNTGYDKSWLRDNFYECIAFMVLEDWPTVYRTYDALLRIFLKHENKIDWAIHHKPYHRHEFIHARFHPKTFEEFWEEWGNKQNDAVGAILFGLGILHENGHNIVKDDHQHRIVQKLVRYLESIRYWEDDDSGMWEENEEIHASSVGACVAGLDKVRTIPGIHVDKGLIRRGQDALKHMLPRESKMKYVDLAQLSLIWPYNVVPPKVRDEILKNVIYLLERKKGVIRYKNDYYYNRNKDGYSEEAEWCFGFSWLAIIYEHLGKKKIAQEYIKKSLETLTPTGEVPELYYSNTNKFNENSPLGWSESLFIVSLHDLHKKHFKF